MFDDLSKSFGGRTKWKHSDGRKNKIQTQIDKRFKPSGELKNYKEMIKTTTDEKSTCVPSQTVSVGIQSRKRQRNESIVDNALNETSNLDYREGRLIRKIRKKSTSLAIK